LFNFQIRSTVAQLRAPAHAARPDDRTARQIGERGHGAGKESVVRVLADRHAYELEARGQLARHVLQAVDADVDPALEQRLLDLLDEHTLRADCRKRDVAAKIA